MKPPHISLLAGLGICVVAVILLVCKIGDTRRNRDTSSNLFIGDDISSFESGHLLDRDLPRSKPRQRSARENLGVLSRLGYVLTADEVGDHEAEGNVHITAPDGRIFKGDGMSISSDGENILLHGSVLVVSVSGFVQGRMGADAFAKIALDAGSMAFVGGSPLYEPGSTFMVPRNAKEHMNLLPY